MSDTYIPLRVSARCTVFAALHKRRSGMAARRKPLGQQGVTVIFAIASSGLPVLQAKVR
jgi:hypothetical protein